MSSADIEQLETQIWEVLSMDSPQSVRHVFYRMTDPRLAVPVAKTEGGYIQVQRRILEMRKAGEIPYQWIVDPSRRAQHTATFSGAQDFLEQAARWYRADPWGDADVYCQIWTESLSLGSVIEDDCRAFGASLYASQGFPSATFVFEAAQDLIRYFDYRGRAAVLYVGDYDPAGVLIDEKIEDGLRDHLIDAGVSPDWMTFERLAITEEQIATYDLPTKPRKATDKRAAHVKHTVEGEAMPTGILRSLVRARMDELLPAGAMDRAQASERLVREQIEGIAANGVGH